MAFVAADGATDFEGHTLILPAVSVGNVAQLTVDLLIVNLKLKRVGCFHDEAVLPLICNDALEKKAYTKRGVPRRRGTLSVAVEVFSSPERKLTVIQQRVPCVKYQRSVFVKNILRWVKDGKFADVILLSSTPSGMQSDSQLQHERELRLEFFTSAVLAAARKESALRLGWKEMGADEAAAGARFREKALQGPYLPDAGSSSAQSAVWSPSPSGLTNAVAGGISPVVDTALESKSLDAEETKGAYPTTVRGGGITRILAKEASSQGVALMGVVAFCSAGDNIHTALQMAKSVLSLTQPSVTVGEWKQPASWEFAFGPPPDRSLYL